MRQPLPLFVSHFDPSSGLLISLILPFFVPKNRDNLSRHCHLILKIALVRKVLRTKLNQANPSPTNPCPVRPPFVAIVTKVGAEGRWRGGGALGVKYP